jgi:hypothetical protein
VTWGCEKKKEKGGGGKGLGRPRLGARVGWGEREFFFVCISVVDGVHDHCEVRCIITTRK